MSIVITFFLIYIVIIALIGIIVHHAAHSNRTKKNELRKQRTSSDIVNLVHSNNTFPPVLDMFYDLDQTLKKLNTEQRYDFSHFVKCDPDVKVDVSRLPEK